MRQLLAFLLLSQLLLATQSLLGQDIPVGSWRTHLTYHTAQQVAIAKDKVYCSSENGLFYLNTTDNSLQTITKIDGLSDNGISDLLYSPVQDYLIIAYTNGNIDILAEDEIINVRTILNSSRPNKNIQHIHLRGSLAVFSTDFGGVELDLNTLTIKDVYENIGGATSMTYSSAATPDSVYLATQQGVYGASLAPGINRQDFSNWSLIPFTQNKNIQHLTVFQDKLHFAVPNDSVYAYQNGLATGLEAAAKSIITNLVTSNDRLYINTRSEIFEVLSNGNSSSLNDNLISIPNDIASDGQIWIADEQAGLIQYNSGSSQNYFPTGTFSASAFRINAINTNILAVSGAYTTSLQPAHNEAGFYQFNGSSWENFTSADNLIGATEIPSTTDIIASAYDPINQKIYLASFGGGLLIWDLSANTFESNAGAPNQLTDLALDASGILWATAVSPNAIYQFDGNTWTQEASPSLPLEIIIDDFNNKWVLQSNGGVLVFNEQGNKERTLSHSEGNGNLRGLRPHSIVKDLEGSIWVGTDDGITEFFDPFSIFNGLDGNFVRDIDGNVIMKDETSTALAVDGGNRKWIGTLNSGVWLYDDNGELLANFNTENSPLLSNEIHDITIQPVTGEIFFATSKGIVSYRGTATTGLVTHGSEVKVFPNPVRPDFNGLVSITGLIQEADVRITDIAGRLVWKGQSEGGTATWNALDFDGKRVKTGVYLVFSSSEDGEDTVVGKVAVVE